MSNQDPSHDIIFDGNQKSAKLGGPILTETKRSVDTQSFEGTQYSIATDIRSNPSVARSRIYPNSVETEKFDRNYFCRN